MPEAATLLAQGLKWALRTAEMLADYDVFWFEEPLHPDALEDYIELRRRFSGAYSGRRSAHPPPDFSTLAPTRRVRYRST